MLAVTALTSWLCIATWAHGALGLSDMVDEAESRRVAHARELLRRYPLIDTHVDTPQVMRILDRQPLDQVPLLGKSLPGHFDIPRAQQGGLGGAFFTVWTPCPEQVGVDVGPNFDRPDNTVRDTIESIDLILELIHHHDTLQLATTADEAEAAFAAGKIAALIGMEGSHMLGNSLSTIRILARLGVRYLTLTHVCHTAFASSAGAGAGTDGKRARTLARGDGLTPLGVELVHELNRLGVLVDISHVSDETMHQVLDVSVAPIAFTHSGARGVHSHPRNVPDDVLARIGTGEGQNDGVIQSVLYPVFIDPNNATIARVADHVEYIAAKTGRRHVGLASDFDGMGSSVLGVEDVSRWPYLVAEFIRRGWSETELAGLLGGNLLRVMRGVERVKQDLAGKPPSPVVYSARKDLPALDWGGPGGAYLPPGVLSLVSAQRIRDEL